ncbi:ABC transporter substrate-binding protein [Clostridium beijerinckii]|uniref:Peptide/nickel transport system substrate-binding protein n=1 Tax=Clostridium beijerinckii TaxID=1520 RepID=A0AAX0B5F4_CLOBE|nr:ABC transporter substrate-binding protein [Clostridium beijerinckii]NRT90134.1 peptide/nickel transport system substrate-binding protein [Clostridium beijerinckii]NYC69664.1 peptide/nickel transport system substrate-binding protein [Clostridium beijerinckii]
MKRIFFYAIMLSFIILFCLGFVNKESNNLSTDDSQETISYGINEIPEDLEKVTNLSKRHEDIICAVSKGLVSKDVDNKIVPSLASEITKSKDGIQYEFKIRDDIFWSDGSKITPNDIATFFKELLKEEDEENIQALLNVYGSKEFREGKVAYETGVAIKGNENSVIIRLNKADDNFLNELTKPQYTLRKYLIMWRNMKNNYSTLIYSGDYKIDSFNKDQVVLKRNENNNKSGIDTIKILNDDSVETSMASYEVKERDIVINPPESELNKLSEQKKLITLPETKGTYLIINSKSNSIPLQGRRDIYNDVCKATESYQNSNNKEFELAEGSFFREDKQDLTKLQARKVISNKEGEWNKPKILTLLCEDTDENRILCRTIEDWFKNNTNITIKYSLVKEEFEDEELKKRYDMILVNNNADSSDKADFYDNFKKYLTEDQNKLLEKLLNTKNNGDYSSLEENLFDNYDILPLVFYNENIAISDKISDLKLDGNGNINFATIQ